MRVNSRHNDGPDTAASFFLRAKFEYRAKENAEAESCEKGKGFGGPPGEGGERGTCAELSLMAP